MAAHPRIDYREREWIHKDKMGLATTVFQDMRQ